MHADRVLPRAAQWGRRRSRGRRGAERRVAWNTGEQLLPVQTCAPFSKQDDQDGEGGGQAEDKGHVEDAEAIVLAPTTGRGIREDEQQQRRQQWWWHHRRWRQRWQSEGNNSLVVALLEIGNPPKPDE